MRFLKFLVVVLALVWPIATALPSIPDRPIFEFTGDGELVFFNTHSGETVDIQYKDEDGDYIEDGIEGLEYIMRCRLTGDQAKMDPKLIELVDHIQDHFNANEVQIISAYRSPKLNNALRAAGRGVGRKSFHMVGKAIDIRIPGVPTREIRDYARSLKVGGVGYYPGPDFVHVDTGPVRYW